MRILTINTGSSSLKAALYEIGTAERLLAAAGAGRIGRSDGRLEILDAEGATLPEERRDLADDTAALRALLSWLGDRGDEARFEAVGHRIVHGGSRYARPLLVTATLIAALTGLVPLAPEHLPRAIAAIR